MAKTCIVCGQAAGSGEHIFPASLGGRRVNSGIYCPKHDNSHSGLVNEIAEQLGLSHGTVRNYLSECIGKLGVANRIEAHRVARQKGWL